MASHTRHDADGLLKTMPAESSNASKYGRVGSNSPCGGNRAFVDVVIVDVQH